MKIISFEIGRFFISQHRPLQLKIVFEKAPITDFTLEHSLGKAYLRSTRALERLIDAFEDLPLLASGREVRNIKLSYVSVIISCSFFLIEDSN